MCRLGALSTPATPAGSLLRHASTFGLALVREHPRGGDDLGRLARRSRKRRCRSTFVRTIEPHCSRYGVEPLAAMADGELAIVIDGRRGDWPGGPQTLTPREPTREPNGTLWFGAELDPAGGQVWSGQSSEKRRRLDELTGMLEPGDRLVVSELSRLSRSLGFHSRRPFPSRRTGRSSS